MRTFRFRFAGGAALTALALAPIALTATDAPPGLPSTDKAVDAGPITVASMSTPLADGTGFAVTGTSRRVAGAQGHDVSITVKGVARWADDPRGPRGHDPRQAAPDPGLVALASPRVTEKAFDPKNFDRGSINVDNKFLPLVPGTEFTYTGTAGTGGAAGTHQVIFTVTEVTKMIDGVRSVAVWDRDYQDGVLAEEELAFMAQDKAGNVWNMGEYPEEHADNGTVSAPSVWLAGRQRAIAGLLMRANPQTNTPSYLEGKAPAIEFLDKASIAQTNQRTCVPTGCYTGVLVVDEFDPLAQPEDGHQFKYHAPGVGVVQIVGKGGTEQETLQLTRLRTLSPRKLQAADNRALQLDRNAYKRAPQVWRGTPPAVVRSDQPATNAVQAGSAAGRSVGNHQVAHTSTVPTPVGQMQTGHVEASHPTQAARTSTVPTRVGRQQAGHVEASHPRQAGYTATSAAGSTSVDGSNVGKATSSGAKGGSPGDRPVTVNHDR